MNKKGLIQWRVCIILSLGLSLTGCVEPLSKKEILTDYNVTQDQINQWNANNSVNLNPNNSSMADLTIVGCVSST